jgi:hypothetical protein
MNNEPKKAKKRNEKNLIDTIKKTILILSIEYLISSYFNSKSS